MRRTACLLLLLSSAPLPAFAWGGTGHRYIGEIAARNFPTEIPGFLKTPDAIARIGLMAQEPDTSRGAGQPHDWDSDPGHFIDAADDGSVFEGPRLSALPGSRRDYDTALRAVKSNEYAAGYLPYNIMDGYEQLVKDFALLRAYAGGIKFARTDAVRAHFGQLESLRQMLTLRDLGVWAHYVGDASQPLHVSVHYNGWGDYPNPNGYVTEPGIHAKFESTFVDKNITEADVAAKLRPYQACTGGLQACTQQYLIATARGTLPVYALEKAGAFDAATPEAKAFTVERIAEGAAMLRDMVTDAWRDAGAASLGYTTKITVADIEAGKADPLLLEQ